MKVIKTKIKDVLVIEPDVFADDRGWFFEPYNKGRFKEHGISAVFVQDSHSFSKKKDTLRGLHLQKNPKAQAKLVRCTSGSVLDVIVDLRPTSPTYKKWVAVELSSDNKKSIYIPKGLAHGFLAATNDVEMQYKLDEFYSPAHEVTIRFDDPELKINWQCSKPILSAKDKAAAYLKDCDLRF